MTEHVETFWNMIITEGRAAPHDILDEEARKKIENVMTSSPDTGAAEKMRYTPADPAHPWRDFQVQSGGRRFLKEVVLPDWVNNHPHENCSGIYVDEWGRRLCKYIQGTAIGVDGPWENPTHFLFYAYDNFQTQQYYGTRLTPFLRDFCGIEFP